MSRLKSLRPVVTLLLLAALPLACGSSTSIDIGAIRVTTNTFGNNLDPDGYLIRVTGNNEDQSQPVDSNGQVLFAVATGNYVVELTERADNCAVDLNPQAARVGAGDTAEVLFNILCG